MDRLYINLEERDYLVPNSQRPRSTPQAAFMSGTNETSGQSGDTIRSQRFSDDSGGSTAELLSHSQVVRYEKKPSEDIVSSV